MPVSRKARASGVVSDCLTARSRITWPTKAGRCMADYSAERGNPSKPAGVYSLLFDAYYLKLMIGGSVTQAWHARSGHKNKAGLFDYSVANQKVANNGPIPE